MEGEVLTGTLRERLGHVEHLATLPPGCDDEHHGGDPGGQVAVGRPHLQDPHDGHRRLPSRPRPDGTHRHQARPRRAGRGSADGQPGRMGTRARGRKGDRQAASALRWRRPAWSITARPGRRASGWRRCSPGSRRRVDRPSGTGGRRIVFEDADLLSHLALADAPAPGGFEADDGGGARHVERLDAAGQRDREPGVDMRGRPPATRLRSRSRARTPNRGESPPGTATEGPRRPGRRSAALSPESLDGVNRGSTPQDRGSEGHPRRRFDNEGVHRRRPDWGRTTPSKPAAVAVRMIMPTLAGLVRPSSTTIPWRRAGPSARRCRGGSCRVATTSAITP